MVSHGDDAIESNGIKMVKLTSTSTTDLDALFAREWAEHEV